MARKMPFKSCGHPVVQLPGNIMRPALKLKAIPEDFNKRIAPVNLMQSKSKRFTFLFLAGLAVAFVAACSPRIAARGNLPEPETLEKIVVGQSTKGDVTDLLGSPSSIAAFDENVWLYISRRTETIAFLAPEVVDQRVVLVSFDHANRVDILSEYTLEDGKPVIPSDRITPTSGKEITILQQLFGNLGRFSGTE